MLPPYFIGILDCHRDPEQQYAMVLDAPLVLIDSRGKRHEAPAGMVTDGASVKALLDLPVIGWLTRLVICGDQFTGPIAEPAVTHDAGYARAKDTTFWKALLSRDRADEDRGIFDGMRARYVVVGEEVKDRKPASWFSAAVVHLMLRAFGWKAWIDDSRAARSLEKLAR